MSNPHSAARDEETTDPAVAVVGLRKQFDVGRQPVEVLSGINFDITRAQSLAITGPSGSGKSTLLHLLGTLDRPSAGKVEIHGADPFALAEADLARFRNQQIGFVFQDHYLLPQYSVLENVLLPILAFDKVKELDRERAKELLSSLGLGHRLTHRPAELSGGERQRVALARALINGPGVMLCDEPTGNLDRSTARALAEVLFDLHRAHSTVLVVVTHSPELASRCARRFELREGSCFEA